MTGETPAAPAPGTRERMIEATMRLLQRDGYAATGWRGVVEEAGTPWGSAYHHFPGGKEQLAVAALELGSRHVLDMLDACLREGASVGDSVRRWFELSAQNLAGSGFRGGCPIATVALETAPASAVLTEACSASFRGWQSRLAFALAEAGVAPPRAAELAALVVTNLEGALLLARVHQDVTPLRVAGDAMARLLDAEPP
jgi:TetR/AcrR family transcriptional repressor of lmrAB and yxaGH operons